MQTVTSFPIHITEIVSPCEFIGVESTVVNSSANTPFRVDFVLREGGAERTSTEVSPGLGDRITGRRIGPFEEINDLDITISLSTGEVSQPEVISLFRFQLFESEGWDCCFPFTVVFQTDSGIWEGCLIIKFQIPAAEG